MNNILPEDKTSHMKSLSRTASTLVCWLLGPLVFLSSFSPAFLKVIYQSSAIQQVMENQNFIDAVPAILSEWITAHRETNKNPLIRAALRGIPQENIPILIKDIFPESTIRESLDDLFFQYEQLMQAKTDQLVVSLIPIKRELTGASGQSSVMDWLNFYSRCSPTQVAAWKQAGNTLFAEIPTICNPGTEYIEGLRPIIQLAIGLEIN